MSFFKTYWHMVEKQLQETGSNPGDIVIGIDQIILNNTRTTNTVVDPTDNVILFKRPEMDTVMPQTLEVRHARTRREERAGSPFRHGDKNTRAFKELSKATVSEIRSKTETKVYGKAKVINLTTGDAKDGLLSEIRINDRSLWARSETDEPTETNH